MAVMRERVDCRQRAYELLAIGSKTVSRTRRLHRAPKVPSEQRCARLEHGVELPSRALHAGGHRSSAFFGHRRLHVECLTESPSSALVSPVGIEFIHTSSLADP